MLNDYFQKMVKDMYDSEGAVALHEIENTRFTATIPVKDLQMLDAIASRFSNSRSNLVGEILSHAVFAMFIALDEQDRKELAKIADEQFDAHMEKNLVKYSRHGLAHWESLNWSIDKNKKDSGEDSQDA